MSSSPTGLSRQVRQARTAVAVCFFINAVFYANVVPRLPEIKDQLGLSNSSLGAALAAAPLGALLAGVSSAVLIRRFGSGRVASSGLVLMGITLWAVSVAPNWTALAAALLLALVIERAMLSGPHEDDRGATREQPAETVHPADDGGAAVPAGKGRRTALRALVALGVLAACGAVVEDAGASWSALYLRSELAAGAAAAGLGFVALQGAMTIGRLTGDRVVDRFGQRLVVQVGGVLIAVGMGLALGVPSVATTLVGFALAGLGVSTLIPAVYHAADELPCLPPGLGLAVINWLLRVGFLLSPPLIGVVADAAGLRVALLIVVLAGIGALLLGRLLRTAAGADRAMPATG